MPPVYKSLLLLITTYFAACEAAAAKKNNTEVTVLWHWSDDELVKNISQQVQVLSKENAELKAELRALKVDLKTSKTELFADISKVMEARQKASDAQIINTLTQQIKTKSESLEQQFSDLLRTLNKPHAQWPRNCAEALQYGLPSGAYKLHLPETALKPFDAYCLQDTDNGPAWTVVQRRQDGTTDFYRDFADYKRGFGNVSNEFFIGLDALHALTSNERIELWITMKRLNNETLYAKYDNFVVGDAASNYKMKSLGEYAGNAEDALRLHEGMMFTTKDADNDLWSEGNCAVKYVGAWWYRKCGMCNPNGVYLHAKTENVEGVFWSHYNKEKEEWNWSYQSSTMQYMQLAIRAYAKK